MSNAAIMKSDGVVSLSRVITATPEQVFAAWTEARQLEQWFGPRGYTIEVSKLDVRAGGNYEFRMQGPDDDIARRTIVGSFKEVSAPTTLVFTWTWIGASGERPDSGESLVTIELLRVADGTDIRITHEKLGSEEARMGHEAGWSGSLVRLVELFA